MKSSLSCTNEPFSWRIRITPESAPIRTQTIVTAQLTNTSAVGIVANRRMLLNHADLPGEVWFHVAGPPGYQNRVSFRVNAGEASEEHYAVLRPGDHVFGQWSLEDFVSTHLPGDYDITLTYHSDRARSPCGQMVSTGIASSSFRITRR